MFVEPSEPEPRNVALRPESACSKGRIAGVWPASYSPHFLAGGGGGCEEPGSLRKLLQRGGRSGESFEDAHKREPSRTDSKQTQTLLQQPFRLFEVAAIARHDAQGMECARRAYDVAHFL